MSIIGGKLLDTGTYSCVFEPKLYCKGERPSRYATRHGTVRSHGRMISKLMTRDEAETEWEISERIRNIPMWKNYYSVSETMCELGSKQTDKDIYTKCKMIKNIPANQLRVLQMPYAGKPIYNYPITSAFDLQKFMIHVIESGALLQVSKIVHFDLHSGNILVDDHTVPRIIDFNLSMMANGPVPESQLSYRFSRNFHLTQQPPDYTAVIGINQDKDMHTISNAIEKKQIIQDIRSFLHIPPSVMISDISNMIRTNTYIKRGDIVGWFQRYWKVIDSWAIGTYFIEFLRKHMMTPHIHDQYKKNFSKIKHVLQKLCAIHPDARWNCMEALAYLHPNSIIIKKYGQQWKTDQTH